MYDLKKGKDRQNYTKGEWFRLNEDKPTQSLAYFCCPGCGELVGITKHTILFDGIVTPSIVCPMEGCKFHEHVRLEGWEKKC